jgi:hypothetical protein
MSPHGGVDDASTTLKIGTVAVFAARGDEDANPATIGRLVSRSWITG